MRHSARSLPGVLLCALLLAASAGRLAAHGGEDHGHAEAAPAAAATAQADRLTTFGQTESFELLVKYPAPKAGGPTTLRLFLADYATNRPISGATLDLSFSPAGVRLAGAPVMRSPGVYELTATFPADTIYTLVATVTDGARTDFLEVRNIYAGGAAERFLAEHGGAGTATTESEDGGKGGLAAMIVALVVGVSLLAAGLIRRRAARSRAAHAAGGGSENGGRGDTSASTNAETKEDRA